MTEGDGGSGNREGERERDRAERKDEGRNINRPKTDPVLPPALILGMDHLSCADEVRKAFMSDTPVTMDVLKGILSKYNRDVVFSLEIVSMFALRPLFDVPLFMSGGRILDYTGQVTFSNRDLKDVSSNTSSYYKFPSSWYEMVYAASDDIWSNINSFNPAGWANVVRPALLRKLIAMAWLRNELQGGMLRDAVWQGFVRMFQNCSALLTSRRRGPAGGFTFLPAGVTKQMLSELPQMEFFEGWGADRLYVTYRVFCINAAAVGEPLTSLYELRGRILGLQAPWNVSYTMHFIIKLLKLLLREVGNAIEYTPFETFLDGGIANVANNTRGPALPDNIDRPF